MTFKFLKTSLFLFGAIFITNSYCADFKPLCKLPEGWSSEGKNHIIMRYNEIKELIDRGRLPNGCDYKIEFRHGAPYLQFTQDSVTKGISLDALVKVVVGDRDPISCVTGGTVEHYYRYLRTSVRHFILHYSFDGTRVEIVEMGSADTNQWGMNWHTVGLCLNR